jgi:hypothetical protein
VIVICAAALAGAGAGIAVGLGEDDEPTDTEPATSTPAPTHQDHRAGWTGYAPLQEEPKLPPVEEDPKGAEPGPSGPPPETTDERAAASAARGYVQALDRRSGEAVCRGFVPGALDEVEFPVDRDSCPATVDASLGFKRRGFPVWEHSQMTDAVSATVEGDSAKVVATVFTVYADVREPTIEDDLIYLQQEGEQWLVAKPSLTLYRAIGDADPPPSVLTPP